MKIVHINTNSSSGGAAIAARRHCIAMRTAGIDAKIVAYRGKEDEITTLYPYKKIPFFQHVKDSLTYRTSKTLVRNSSWTIETSDFDISRCDVVRDADIIYVHWVAGYLGTGGIKNLLELGKPVVWYMHDMNPITGGCHYSFNCRGYEKDCSDCSELRCIKHIAAQQLYKHMVWNKYSNLIGAAPSQWLTECIRHSSVFRAHQAFCIPNVIDTDLFRPLDKASARAKHNLPQDKKLIMFASMGAHNRYKGSKYLVEVINRLSKESDYEFMVAGIGNVELFSLHAQKKIHSLGMISGEQQMSEIYNAADVYLITSMAENFPNVIIECMACGVPAVGFKTGGIKDQIQHKENGWIVEQEDTDGLIEGLKWVLNDADNRMLSNNARQYVLSNCSYNKVTEIHRPVLSLSANK